MLPLEAKNVVVIGASRGIGRRIVEKAASQGARVLAVARGEEALRQLSHEVVGVEILALDATDESAPAKVFGLVQPDVLVLCGGAFPPATPLHEQNWTEFTVNWQVDVKMAFHFCKAALCQPLSAGASVILISSGAALGGSPISGGYAGAKRMQLFIASYSQKESDRLGLGLRFVALAPRIVSDTELGKYAIEGYSRYLGISESDFTSGMGKLPTSFEVAAATIELATNVNLPRANAFAVSTKGLEAISL